MITTGAVLLSMLHSSVVAHETADHFAHGCTLYVLSSEETHCPFGRIHVVKALQDREHASDKLTYRARNVEAHVVYT